MYYNKIGSIQTYEDKNLANRSDSSNDKNVYIF